MNDLISPKYQMNLIKAIQEKIWLEFPSYEQVKFYISKWHENNYEVNSYNNDYWENFQIIEKDSKKIDLLATLNSMKGDTLLKIAIDLELETPDFIPSIPTFKNEIKTEFPRAYDTFSKAIKLIESDPSTAVGLVNSTLESIIKEILKDNRIGVNIKGNETLYALSQIILKEFNLTGEDLPKEIKTMGSQLISICQSIEKLRSEKTNFHGKTDQDYLITDTIYTYFVINSVTTIGLFLNSYYRTKYPKSKEEEQIILTDDCPF